MRKSHSKPHNQACLCRYSKIVVCILGHGSASTFRRLLAVSASAVAVTLLREVRGSPVFVAPTSISHVGGKLATDNKGRFLAQRKAFSGKPTLVIAQWNLAGVNSNPLEFKTSSSDAARQGNVALQFTSALNDLVKAAIEGQLPHSASDIVTKTSRELLRPLEQLAHNGSALAAALIKHARSQEAIRGIAVLREAAKGGKTLGRADLRFKQRFSILGITPANAGDVFDVYTSQTATTFWAKWLTSMDKIIVGPDSAELNDVVLLATYEALLRDLCTLVWRDPARMWPNKGDVAESFRQLATLMNVEPNSKANGVAKVVRSICERCPADVWTLQEFSYHWLENPEFRSFWSILSDEYFVFSPTIIPKRSQATLLLVRKAGILAINAAATRRVASVAASAEFYESLFGVFGALFGNVAQAQIRKVQRAMASKVAFAACNIKLSNGTIGQVLVASLHARSDGTDNLAMVAALQHLANATESGLLAGLDANSNAEFSNSDSMAAAGTQQMFVEFVSARGLMHCFEHLGANSYLSPAQHYTVRKMRTYLQAQLTKAGKIDQSGKDWVVCGEPATSVRGVRANRQLLSGRGFPAETEVWNAEAWMPTLDFPSDHALVLARVEF